MPAAGQVHQRTSADGRSSISEATPQGGGVSLCLRDEEANASTMTVADPHMILLVRIPTEVETCEELLEDWQQLPHPTPVRSAL